MTVEYEMFDVGLWMLEKHLGGMLSSLRDFLFRLRDLPSHKWLGYSREIWKASDDSTPYSLNPASRLENSPALQRWVQRQKINKVPEGRKNHYFNPAVVNRPLSSLRDFLFRLHDLPSHKWLGYFREIWEACDDFAPYGLNPASRLENSPALQRWVQHQKTNKVPQGRLMPFALCCITRI